MHKSSPSPGLPRLQIALEPLPDGIRLAADTAWEPRLDHSGRICAYTGALNGSGWLYLPELGYFRFSSDEESVEAFPEEGAPAQLIEEAFNRLALPMALQAAGFEVLHASAVSDGERVHVFCGASRSGKSTIAYALGQRGLEVWADDAVAFKTDEAGIIAIPLPFALRLREEVAEFYDLPADAKRRKNEKSEALRHQPVGRRPIVSISTIERGPKATIRRLSPGESLPAVVYHSFYFSLEDPAVRRRMSTQFLELIATVPVFRIAVPPGLAALGEVLDELEESILAPPAQ